ncbi:MAG: hypothetical protein AAGJ96_12085 [Pseudomonadota bacterium]
MGKIPAPVVWAALFGPQAVYVIGAIAIFVWGTADTFQRFGSVGVALSLFAFGAARTLAIQLKRRDDRRYAIAEISSGKLLLALVGTVQWGYGDLLFDWVKRAAA